MKKSTIILQKHTKQPNYCTTQSAVFFTNSRPLPSAYVCARERQQNYPLNIKKRTNKNKKNQAVLKQFSHVPYLELKLPPPLCCAYSEITARAQMSQVRAISPSDIGCESPLKLMLNLDFAFTERSSCSLQNQIVAPNSNHNLHKSLKCLCI